MCTALFVPAPDQTFYLGRTMDFSYPLDPCLYFVPRGYQWNSQLHTRRFQNRYSFMGIGQNISPIAFADGVNEHGFAAAALYFPDYAFYDAPPVRDSPSVFVAAIELVAFLLGQCSCVSEAASLLNTIKIIGTPDTITDSIAPLHWILADKTGSCLTVEKTRQGLILMPNPIGVLSNSPDFDWHMTNLRNYLSVTPTQRSKETWGDLLLAPFGQGSGTFGLPGDYTPPSRFVRAAWQKSHVPIPRQPDEALVTCFHLLDCVSIPKGSVVTQRETFDYTQYTAFIRLTDKSYFFSTYNNPEIMAVPFPGQKSLSQRIYPFCRLTRPISFHTLSST